MNRRRLALIVLAAALVAVPAALPKTSALAQGRITGSGTSWTLTITNLSTDGKSIHCIRFFGPSNTPIASVQTPSGWTSTGSNAFSFGFRQDNPGIPPGGTLAINFTTQGALTAGGILHYSTDCVEDVIATVPPPTPTTPPPPPTTSTTTTTTTVPKPSTKPCKCTKLTVTLDPTLLNKKIRPDKHDFGVGITWRMTCSSGIGGCAGTIHFLPPAVFAGSVPQSNAGLKLNLKRFTIVCAGPCQKSTTGRFQITMLSRDQLNKLFGRTLAYTLVTRCGKTTKRISVRVFVDSSGTLRPAA